MAKQDKKGVKGSAQKYISRSRAVRKLQISLALFRRLCILKGVYPVQPRHALKLAAGNTQLKTWYYRKDIAFLAHEPILQALRQEKVHARKMGKALAKQEWTVAKVLRDEAPVYSLHHIIKERYCRLNQIPRLRRRAQGPGRCTRPHFPLCHPAHQRQG